jgi:hypothetical protein
VFFSERGGVATLFGLSLFVLFGSSRRAPINDVLFGIWKPTILGRFWCMIPLRKRNCAFADFFGLFIFTGKRPYRKRSKWTDTIVVF